MNSISNLSGDTLEEISYWKQKNNALIKELLEYKNVQRELKQNMDYLVKEKFLSDQKIDRIEGVFKVLNRRTRSCLDKVVECSTDLTEILRELSEVQKMKDSLKVFGIGSLTERMNEISSNPNPVQMVGSLEKPEAEENTSLNELTFVSRGGKTVPIENSLGLPQSDMESEIDDADGREDQYIAESAEQLSTIYEDLEQSSIINEEAQGQPGFASSDSVLDYVQLKKISQINDETKLNLEKGESHSDNEDDDMSTRVEASTTILENSILNSTNPQGNNIAVIPKLTPSTKPLGVTREQKLNSPTSPSGTVTSRRLKKRKSIGSPRPSSEGSTKLIPQHFSTRKSIGSPRPPSERIPNILSQYISSRRSLHFSPDISNIKQQPSAQTTNSPWSPSENVAVRRTKKLCEDVIQEKPMTSSFLGTTIQDGPYLVDYIKNTSTPIALENISRISSNAEIRIRNVGDKKSGYAHKKRRKFKADNPDDDRSIEQENNTLHSETNDPYPNETSLGRSKQKNIDNTSIAPKSPEVFQSVPRTQRNPSELVIETELTQASKTCTEEPPVDSSDSSPIYSRRKKGSVIYGRRYEDSDTESEQAPKTCAEESPVESSNSSPRYSRRKKCTPVSPLQRYVESNLKRERDHKKRSKFNSVAKVDEPSVDQQNTALPEASSPCPDDGSLRRPSRKQNDTRASIGPKTAEVSQRDEELEHASKSSTAETTEESNDSSLRSSRRKKCPTTFGKIYMDALQREKLQSELSTKSRRAVKKVVYKEPSMKHKMRRT